MPPGLMRQVPVSQSGTHLKTEKRADVGVNHEDAVKCISDDHAACDQQVMCCLSRSTFLTEGGPGASGICSLRADAMRSLIKDL